MGVVCLSALGLGEAAASTLVVCSEASPQTLNPALAWSTINNNVANPYYNRLVEIERGGGAIVPALAESWEVSPDGLTYTFRLRKGVKFHTSKSFTPSRDFNVDDVIFTLQRYRDKTSPYYGSGGSNEYFEYLRIGEQITDIKRLDDYTLQLTLGAPNGTFLPTLANEPMSIQSEEYAAKMLAAGTKEKLDNEPVGTGPFELVQYQKDAILRYRKFEDYWADKAGHPENGALVDDLVFAITPDPSVRIAKLKAGECQIAVGANPSDLLDLKSSPDENIELMTSSGIAFGFMAFNTAKPPFNDERVRRAIAMSIKKDAIIDLVYGNLVGVAAETPIPPDIWGHADIAALPYDPEQAKKLLAEAGHAEGLALNLWYSDTRGASWLPNQTRAAELIQADLAAVGIKASVQMMEISQLRAKRKAGGHDLFFSGWVMDYPHPNGAIDGLFNCEAGAASGIRWCNQEFDKLFYEARNESDREKATALYRRMQEILADELPVYIIANSVNVVPISKTVEGFKIHTLGGQPYWGVSVKE
jgi:dipeptide transport system substrate-binding protein